MKTFIKLYTVMVVSFFLTNLIADPELLNWLDVSGVALSIYLVHDAAYQIFVFKYLSKWIDPDSHLGQVIYGHQYLDLVILKKKLEEEIES